MTSNNISSEVSEVVFAGIVAPFHICTTCMHRRVECSILGATSSLLGCNTVYFGRQVPIFWKNLLPPPSG